MVYKVGVIGTLTLVAVFYWLMRMPDVAISVIPNTGAAVERGEYLVAAGGCVSCHESIGGDSSLSGGLALETDFGVFYAPNITPDNATGVGLWDANDFIYALKHGRRPEGGFYFPAFPYIAYAGMSDADVLDIAAYLRSLPAVESSRLEHDIPFWLASPVMAGWNMLARFVSSPAPIEGGGLNQQQLSLLERGEYLARHLGHCGECHTPRNLAGMVDGSAEFAGASVAGEHVEAINAVALAEWSEVDFAFFLLLGLKPDGDFVGGEMESVIEHNTSKLTDDDRLALAKFFKRGE